MVWFRQVEDFARLVFVAVNVIDRLLLQNTICDATMPSTRTDVDRERRICVLVRDGIDVLPVDV